MRRGQRGDLFSQVVSEDLSVILIENSKQERTREGEDKGMGEGEVDEAPVGEAEGQPRLGAVPVSACPTSPAGLPPLPLSSLWA